MKISIVMGFFLPMPPVEGGATEKSWHGFALEFARRGHEVTVISRRRKGWPAEETIDGVRHLRIPGWNHSRSLARNLLRDLVWSLRAARALPPSDITVVNCIALPVWLGRIRRAGKIVVMTGRMPKGQYRLYGRVDRVFAGSSMLRDAVLAENPRLASRSVVFGCPIPWTALAAPRPAKAPGTPVTIGYVGRIHREKGLDLLAAALGRLHRGEGRAWRVVLCGPSSVAQGGSGPAYVDELKAALAAALPAGGWELLPPIFVEGGLAKLYRDIDVFCYPSIAAQGETFGVAVAEAMAAGAVPVVSSLPCFTDFVRPGENGEVFDHSAPDAAGLLAGALRGLVSDPGRRERMAEAARAEVRRYDVAALAESLLRDFASLP